MNRIRSIFPGITLLAAAASLTACMGSDVGSVDDLDAVGQELRANELANADVLLDNSHEDPSVENGALGLSVKQPHTLADELIPASEALELRDVSASVRNVQGLAPAFVAGSLRLEAGDENDPLGSQSAIAPENIIGPSLYDSGEFTYESGLWGTSYDVLVARKCPGYTRDLTDAYAYNSNGGYCAVGGWYTQDSSDCRFLVHVGASKYKHGTCAWSVYANEQGVFSYSATNTNSAQQNTTNSFIYLNAGQTLTVGTCGLAGASSVGDTYLRLFDGGTQVALNDDACGGVSSQLLYTATASKKFEIRAGCFSSGSCSGTVVWSK